MPICTSCTHPTPYLYTTYESAYNLRLEQCTECRETVDPYVEHDVLTILLDLVLLKRGVFRHLLYNRGAEPRRAAEKGKDKGKEVGHRVDPDAERRRERARWATILQLGLASVVVDSFIRWGFLNRRPISTPWGKDVVTSFSWVLFATIAETLAFHGGTMLGCMFFLRVLDKVMPWFPRPKKPSYIRQEFRPSLIPLSLFYSSIPKLFLLLLLTIWLPITQPPADPTPISLPTWIPTLGHDADRYIYSAFTILDDSSLDREWVVRNILGGMSAGFGLRVILDVPPIFTTLIIIAGWSAKAYVAILASDLVGQSRITGEAWLAYSIP